MIETILSIVGVLAGWFSAYLIGYFVGKKDDRVKFIKLPNGDELHMWQGFIDPSCVFVGVNTDKDGNYIDGDGVTFDKEGHIIQVHTNVKKR